MAEKANKKPETNAAAANADAKAKPGGETVHAPKKVKKTKWNLARALKRARRFETQEAWRAGNPSSFKAAEHWGWMKECTAHMKASPNVTKLTDHKRTRAAKKPAGKTNPKKKSA